MGISYFHKGAVIQIKHCQHVMMRQTDKNVWQTEEALSGRLHQFTINELQALYENGDLVFYDDSKPRATKIKQGDIKIIPVSPQPSDSSWSAAKIRRIYVKAVEYLPSTESVFRNAIKKVWDECQQPLTPPNWTTVFRWRAKYLSQGSNAHTLVEQHQKKGNRERRYPALVLQIVDEIIDRIYMTRTRNSVTKTLEHAIVAVDRENKLRPPSMHLPLPTRRLIQGVIDTMPAFDKHAARYGRTAAIRTFRAKLRHIVTDHRLEVAEIDHTKLDLFVLSDDDWLPLGRPWVTVCIDNHTRCILGIYIGFEPPSYLSVSRCLKHAFLPKTSLRTEYPNIRNEWAAHGIMQRIVVDNGLEFHSNGFEQACYSFGIEIEYTPRKSPWYKGKIERFNRSMNEGVGGGVPGTTFNNIFEKDDYDPSKHAVVRLSALREIVYKWIADYYHQKPHSALDHATPAAFWEASGSGFSIPLPDDPNSINIMLGKADKATLSHKGIRCNRLDYNSDDMVSLRRQYGDKLELDIRIDESNLGHIHVKHPETDGYIEVAVINKEYAEGISLWQHNVFRNYAVQHLKKDNPVGWAQATVEIAAIIEREIKGKRRSRTNSKLGRFQEATEEGRKSTARKIAKVVESSPIPLIPALPPSTPVVRKKLTAIIEQRGK